MAATSPTRPGLGVPTVKEVMKNTSLILGVMNSAKKGDFVAQLRLSRCYESGIGVAADLGEARIWHLKAEGIVGETIDDFAKDSYCNIGPDGSPSGSDDES